MSTESMVVSLYHTEFTIAIVQSLFKSRKARIYFVDIAQIVNDFSMLIVHFSLTFSLFCPIFSHILKLSPYIIWIYHFRAFISFCTSTVNNIKSFFTFIACITINIKLLFSVEVKYNMYILSIYHIFFYLFDAVTEAFAPFPSKA